MSDAPVLPLSPGQAQAVLKALQSALPEAGPDGSRDTAIGPVIERLLVTLIGELRAEGEGDGPSRSRRRAIRGGFVTGAFGAVGAAPREATELVEQARAAVRIATDTVPARDDARLAADLLVVWGLCDSQTQALAFTQETADDSLLTTLLRDQEARVRDVIPDGWTVRTTLRFVWDARAVLDLVDVVRGGGGFVQAIPVVGAVPGAWSAGRGMKRFEKNLRALLVA